MRRGKLIVQWSEPKTWNQAARRTAKAEGRRLFPWRSWAGLLILIGALTVWQWSDADPKTRASIPKLVGIIVTLFGVLIGLAWINVLLSRTTSTKIYTGGVADGSRFKMQWVPWDEIDYFYTDEHNLGDDTFRFLSWQRVGSEDESFSVLPDDIDLQSVVQLFKTNQIEEVEQVGDGDAEEAV